MILGKVLEKVFITICKLSFGLIVIAGGFIAAPTIFEMHPSFIFEVSYHLILMLSSIYVGLLVIEDYVEWV